MARVLIRPKAQGDLDDLSDYIAEQSSNARARDVLQTIHRKSSCTPPSHFQAVRATNYAKECEAFQYSSMSSFIARSMMA